MNALEAFKAARKHIDEAMAIVGRGPFAYYLERLIEHSEALMTKYAPLVDGDRAVICRFIECKGGWNGCERTLAIGQIGTVRHSDYYDGRFIFDFEPDNQWWKDIDGNWQPADRKHTYRLRENELAKVEPQGDRPHA